MKRKIISAALSFSMVVGIAVIPQTGVTAATEKTPQYKETPRLMEGLNRGLVAVYRTVDNRSVLPGEGGVYLSWRLLGTESLTNQAFDIYRSTSATGTFTKIKTTGVHDATNYIDTSGTASNYYKVVKAGASAAEVKEEKAVAPTENHTAKGSEVGNGNSEKNSFTYVDIPISRPDDIKRDGDGKTSRYYSYDSSHEGGANDASVGDLDGDGDYELVLKWDPTDSKDSAGADYTGRVYIDGYEIDPNNGGEYMWRIDLGQNITAGAHYTQFIVYDFDGDGCSEIAMATAPGTKDGQGHYVTEVGDTAAIRNADNTALNIGSGSGNKGKNLGPEYYTIFEGATGRALYTTAAIPLGTSGEWGDSKYNRASRFLAGVAYLDGVHPSYIACRGYYDKAVLRAYSWDGETMSMQWEHNGSSNSASTMYGQGNHNLSIADIDNDGCDEIVYGSAALDQDGKTVLGNTRLGHGDAIHTSDFNNDGIQETYSIKEESGGYKKYASDLRTPKDGKHFWDSGKIVSSSDNGRGVMANVEDEYASTHSNAPALWWDASHDNIYDINGDAVGTKPSLGSRSAMNFLIYWDGDLSREIMDDTIIGKYHIETDDSGNITSSYTRRFYSGDGYSLTGSSSNNFTKYTPCLSADIWGDWREEVIMAVNKSSNTEQAYLRIFTSTLPSSYRLTTLMHDSQYRTNVAIQNVGYNQPPHQSYYIGKTALATDSSGSTLNYLAPETAYTNAVYSLENVPVESVTLSDSNITVERTKTAVLKASVMPSNASKKTVSWTSSDASVATVSNGIVTGVKDGTATIKVTTKDGEFTASCTVTVYTNSVTGISLSSSTLDVGEGYSKPLTATVLPDNATDKTVKWSSSNTSVVTVDNEGTVTGVTGGAAVVTATTADGGYKAECIVHVYPFVITDVTGDDAFTSSGASDTTTIKTGANSATITHNDSAEGASVSKTFTSYSDNRASLSFRFTTGGQKYDGTNWNWTGHEYTTKVKLLDKDGNNIITLAQSYGDGTDGGAGKLTSSLFDKAAENIESTWAVDGLGNIQGSAKRWIVNVEFDYDNDICSVSITGTDGTWEAVKGTAVCTPFELNGASFGALEIETEVDGTGTIKASPTLAELVYQRIALDSGGEVPTLTPTEAPTIEPIKVVNNVTSFVADERVTVTTEAGAIKFTAGSKANDKYARAYSDLSQYLTGQDKYEIEYDSYLPSTSRARVALCDLAQRPGSSNKNGYDTTGVVFSQGVVDSSSYAVNEDKSIYGMPNARDQYVHTKLTVNAKAKTVDFVITDSDGAVMKSVSGLSYLDSGLEAPTGLEMLNTINDDVTYMKNITVTTYEYPTPAPQPTAAPMKYKESGVAITAVYNDDGTLKSLTVQNVNAGDNVITSSNKNEKVFSWNSLEGMKPIETEADA